MQPFESKTYNAMLLNTRHYAIMPNVFSDRFGSLNQAHADAHYIENSIKINVVKQRMNDNTKQ